MAMVPDLEDWITSSNDALNISLVAPSSAGSKLVANFHPTFTYPVFGEDEKIFGYKDLKINLKFRASDMRPHVGVSFGQKFKALGTTVAMDPIAMLQEGNHLPQIAYVKEADFESNSSQLSNNWTPPGILHSTIRGPDGDYEIWRGNLADEAVKQLNNRIQILVSLFIEGGSYIGDDVDAGSDYVDDRWTLFFLYRKHQSPQDTTKSSYIFVGFSSVYRFYFFRPPSPPPSPNTEWEMPAGNVSFEELTSRTRLSQFVILPPFQGKGNGARLYQTIFQHYLHEKDTLEFAIESPNEAFDELRDACDLKFLKTIPEFQSLRLDTTVSLPRTGVVPPLIKTDYEIEAIRQKSKIAPRQFARVLEMHIMSQLPDSIRPQITPLEDPPAPSNQDLQLEKLWQLLLKKRLYRHNRDALSQLASAIERREKLEDAFRSVELEYARLLSAHGTARGKTENGMVTTNGKRKLDDAENTTSSKKARVDDA